MTMTQDLLFLDSITDAKADAIGCIAVSGSHGGLFAAAVASRARLRAVILNDAGRGLGDAGIAGVKALARVGMAACAIDCMSAEIGSARDGFENGVISYANTAARALGVATGQSVKDAVARLENASAPIGQLDEMPEARWQEPVGAATILCVDSASLVRPEDAGQIIVTGSHGGLIGGNPERACKAEARLVSFSDAGRGKNNIGLSRLPALELRRIAAITLDCKSCEIGNAASALRHGIISAANTPAQLLGVSVGISLKDAILACLVSGS
jgi:nucleotidyltransferase/DNA polymerase involved in DNA repair